MLSRCEILSVRSPVERALPLSCFRIPRSPTARISDDGDGGESLGIWETVITCTAGIRVKSEELIDQISTLPCACWCLASPSCFRHIIPSSEKGVKYRTKRTCNALRSDM